MSSYLTSFFSRDPAGNFQYEIGETILDDPSQFLWSICEGKKKGSGEVVTIFILDLKSKSNEDVDLGKGMVKRLKMLKHPNIISFLDSLETDKVIYLVTEECLPLSVYLQRTKLRGNQKEMAASWGIYQIANCIKFLSGEAHLMHNNVNSTSVFVTGSGEWKLGGFEFVIVAAGQNSSLTPTKPQGLEKYSAPEMKSGRINYSEPWTIDMWGLACLLWEVFNGGLPDKNSLKSSKQIPKSLHSLYASMISGNPGRRPTPEDFLKECRKPGGFMKNKFVETLLFLEEFQLKEAREKTQFFTHLKDQLDLFPDDVAKNKILPLCIHAYQYGEAGSSVLNPLFKLSKLLSEAEYQDKIVPCIVKLFSSTDRATRVKLLEKLEDFVDHLGSGVVNDKIFPSLKSGFMDTNPAVRESTVKSMIFLAPKLNYQNLNVELMGHFARLQGKDDQPGIRTNTSICLGKIGAYIHPSNRQKILISAFSRAMKDPFPPARVAGVLALSATQQYYQLIEIANRILPALAALTTDPEKNVRDQAFKSIKGFLEKLEKASENPDLIPEIEAGVNAGSGGGVLSPEKVPQWASWALSAISGKFYKSPPPQKSAEVSGLEKKEGELNNKPDEQGNNAARKIDAPEKRIPSVSYDGWEDDADDDEWGTLDDDPEEKFSVGEKVKKEDPFRMKVGKPDEKPVSWDEDDEEEEEPWSGWDDNIQVKKQAKVSVGSGSGLKLGGRKQQSNDKEDLLDELLGIPSSASTTKSKSSLGEKKLGGSRESKENAGLSASTAFGATGPVKTTLDKKKPSKNEESDFSSGWDFDAGDDAFSNKKEDGWGDSGSGWGDEGWGETESVKKPNQRKPVKSAEQRRAELEEKRKAKQSSKPMKLGAKKVAKD